MIFSDKLTSVPVATVDPHAILQIIKLNQIHVHVYSISKQNYGLISTKLINKLEFVFLQKHRCLPSFLVSFCIVHSANIYIY